MPPEIILYKSIPADLQDYLAGRSRLTVVSSLKELLAPEMKPVLARAEGLLGVGEKAEAQLLDKAPRLRAISTISVGYDFFDVADLTRRNILLMHTPDILTETTADMIFMLILCAARRATEMIELVRQRRWRQRIGPELFGTDVHGKKLGILGMGRIGRAVARRAERGFNMEILYYNRSASVLAETEFNARRCSLTQILAEADFICIILPLSDQTRKLIGRRELALMKPTAFLINAGRGPVVDEAALLEALQRGTIRGAGLDVYEQEPLSLDSPLLSLPNVTALPHIGSATHETRQAMARCAIDNILAALAGETSSNCVNPEAAGPDPALGTLVGD